MIFGIMPLLLLGAIIVLIVRLVGQRGHNGPAASGTTVLRRFFQYLTLYGVLVVVAIGRCLISGGFEYVNVLCSPMGDKDSTATSILIQLDPGSVLILTGRKIFAGEQVLEP